MANTIPSRAEQTKFLVRIFMVKNQQDGVSDSHDLIQLIKGYKQALDIMEQREVQDLYDKAQAQSDTSVPVAALPLSTGTNQSASVAAPSPAMGTNQSAIAAALLRSKSENQSANVADEEWMAEETTGPATNAEDGALPTTEKKDEEEQQIARAAVTSEGAAAAPAIMELAKQVEEGS